MDKILKISILVIIIILIILPACNTVTQSPLVVVKNYLDALVNKEPATLISLSCKNWEFEAQKELDSFMNVGTTLDGLNCKIKAQSNIDAKVVCQGFIKLTYDTEIQKIDLSKHIYELTLENNDWRVCNIK